MVLMGPMIWLLLGIHLGGIGQKKRVEKAKTASKPEFWAKTTISKVHWRTFLALEPTPLNPGYILILWPRTH